MSSNSEIHAQVVELEVDSSLEHEVEAVLADELEQEVEAVLADEVEPEVESDHVDEVVQEEKVESGSRSGSGSRAHARRPRLDYRQVLADAPMSAVSVKETFHYWVYPDKRMQFALAFHDKLDESRMSAVLIPSRTGFDVIMVDAPTIVVGGREYVPDNLEKSVTTPIKKISWRFNKRDGDLCDALERELVVHIGNRPYWWTRDGIATKSFVRFALKVDGGLFTSSFIN